MTMHVYHYHAQSLRRDGKVDMFHGIFRTDHPVVDEASYKRARVGIQEMCGVALNAPFVLMSFSHIATVG